MGLRGFSSQLPTLNVRVDSSVRRDYLSLRFEPPTSAARTKVQAPTAGSLIIPRVQLFHDQIEDFRLPLQTPLYFRRAALYIQYKLPTSS